MFFSHCLQLLGSGGSTVRPDQVTDITSVMFRLHSGVRIKKLDSIKTSLLMIEAIRLSWSRCDYGSCDSESMRMFDNFVSYTYGMFSAPIAMALIKYAIKDRNLSMRNASQSSNWLLIEQSFKGPLLNNKPSMGDMRVSNQFERCYKRLKCCMSISNCLNEFIAAEMDKYKEKSVLALDRHILAEYA